MSQKLPCKVLWHISHNILVLHTEKQYEHSSKQVTQDALLVTRFSICDPGCTWKAAIWARFGANMKAMLSSRKSNTRHHKWNHVFSLHSTDTVYVVQRLSTCKLHYIFLGADVPSKSVCWSVPAFPYAKEWWWRTRANTSIFAIYYIHISDLQEQEVSLDSTAYLHQYNSRQRVCKTCLILLKVFLSQFVWSNLLFNGTPTMQVLIKHLDNKILICYQLTHICNKGG